MTLSNVEDELKASMVALLGVISRWGSTVCMDRATRLYLSPFRPDRRRRMRLLEDISYLFLVEGEHDPRIDVIYEFITRRVSEMGGAGLAPEFSPAE